MLYKLVLQKMITVEPRFLGCALNRALKQLLRSAVEGTRLPPGDTVAEVISESKSLHKSSAIIVAVLDILDAENIQGRVLDNGSVSFLLTYEAMVLKLHRGEVIDVKVISVDPEGWHGSVFGVSKLFVSHARMSESLQNPEWEFDSEGRWYNTKDEKSIQPEDIVRVRVIAETPQTEDTMAIGSMMEEYLGPLNTKGRALY